MTKQTKKIAKTSKVTKKVTKKADAKKTKKVEKSEKPKWPLKKFINKFFYYNVFLTLGLVMLILSFVCKGAFTDQGKITGNIVCSSLVLFAGFAGGLVYSLLLHYRGEQPLDVKYSRLTKILFWMPVVGIVMDKIWKHNEKNLDYQQRLVDNPNAKKNKMVLPNSISIIFAALIGVVFLIWILYISGVLKPNEANTIPGILDIFLNPLRGFAGYKHQVVKTVGGVTKVVTEQVNGVGSIVIFLLLFNGTMTLVNDARAIEAGIGSLLKKMHGKEIVLIPILMIVLAICGSTFNMCEQLLPLFLIVIPIFFAAGYDRMTGFLVVFMSAGVGVLGSTVNPVLIGTAISAMETTAAAANVTLMTGIVWRLVIFVVVTAASITCTMLYARKVKKNPSKSCVYMSKEQFAKEYSFDQDALPPMTGKRRATLIVFAIAFLMLIIGFIDWATITGWNGFNAVTVWLKQYFPFVSSIGGIGSWGMVEAGMLFFIAAFIIGAINWKSAGHWFATLYAGCREFIGVAFIVAVAKGLAITMTDSGFNGMIATGLGGVLGKMGSVGAILMVFLVICLLTIFIPSSSGLASAMFPVIGPAIYNANAALLSGSVTSFAAAMGYVNLFTPTGMVLPFLEVSKMDMNQFFKASWKQLLILLVLTVGLLAVGTVLPAGLF